MGRGILMVSAAAGGRELASIALNGRVPRRASGRRECDAVRALHVVWTRAWQGRLQATYRCEICSCQIYTRSHVLAPIGARSRRVPAVPDTGSIIAATGLRENALVPVDTMTGMYIAAAEWDIEPYGAIERLTDAAATFGTWGTTGDEDLRIFGHMGQYR